VSTKVQNAKKERISYLVNTCLILEILLRYRNIYDKLFPSTNTWGVMDEELIDDHTQYTAAESNNGEPRK
jgi:hypothetical protein